MRRNLPPFPALRAFEAAARLGSFRGAAEELCVTPSAISHQVRNLEDHLGHALYDRDGHATLLNEHGRAYLRRIAPLLDDLDTATSEIFKGGAENVLSVQATPAVLARWLIPRLSDLREATGLELRLAAGFPPTDFSSGTADIIIHWGAKPVPGVVIEPFLSTPKIAVASPALIERFGHPLTPAGLASYVRLRDEVDDCWAEWLRGAGATDVDPEAGPVFAHCELVFTAAERGQGVALAYAALAEQDIADGRLVRLFDHATVDKRICSVAYPEECRRNRNIRSFTAWIMSQVREVPDHAAAG